MPERQMLLRALQKRRQKEYKGLSDHVINEIFLTGVLTSLHGSLR